jgi:hypothetical protein
MDLQIGGALIVRFGASPVLPGSLLVVGLEPTANLGDCFLRDFWWSQTESNRRPLQCHCHGPTIIEIYYHCLRLPNLFEIGHFWCILISYHFPSSLFGGDVVAILM